MQGLCGTALTQYKFTCPKIQ